MELIGSLFLILALAVIVGLFVARPFINGYHEDSGAAERSGLPDKAGVSEQASEHQHSALLAERDRLLNALQELDFDNALGKVPEEEYPQQRAVLLQQGAETLRRLDEFTAQESAHHIDAAHRIDAAHQTDAAHQVDAAARSSAEDRIEAAVAARRADAAHHIDAAHQVDAARKVATRELASAQPVGAAMTGGKGNGHSQPADELENIIASRKRERKESTAGFCPKCGKPVSKSDKFCSRCGATL